MQKLEEISLTMKWEEGETVEFVRVEDYKEKVSLRLLDKWESKFETFVRSYWNSEERTIKDFGGTIERKPYLEKLDTILQRTSKGEITLEDAEDFVKIRSSVYADSDKVQKIWMNYIINLLGPVYSSLYSFAIIGILAEEEGSLSYKDIRNRVQKIFSEKFDRYKRYEFKASFDVLLHPAITKYPLIEEHGKLFKKYTLTQWGKIAYILLMDSIEEVLHSGEKKVD